MKHILNAEPKEIISVICALENTIAQKQANLFKLDIKPLVEFQKNEILNLKSFLKSLKHLKII